MTERQHIAAMAREKQSRYVMARHRPHDAPNAKIQQALSQSGVMP